MSLEVRAVGASDVGRKRKHNEDSFLIDERLQLYVVADGMGGHAAGDVASSYAIEVFQDYIEKHQEPFKRLAQEHTTETRSNARLAVEKAVQTACAEVHKLGERELSKRGMGTTFVGIVVAGTRAVVGHVGDSRVYLLRAGMVHRLTEDHTLVAAQIASGLLKPEEAEKSAYAHVLTRAVGKEPSVQVDTLMVELQASDRFLLCSDGLHNYLSDLEVGTYLLGASFEQIPGRLVALANERGGKDNITSVVLEVAGAGPKPQVQQELTSPGEQIDALRFVNLFRHLNYKEQASLLAIATTKNYPSGAVVIKEGEASEEMYIIARGSVTVEKQNTPLANLLVGSSFGEMSLLESSPRSTTVKTTAQTVLLVIGRNDMLDLMRRDSVLAVKLLWSFLGTVTQRLRAANTEIAILRKDTEDAVFDAIKPFLSESKS